MADMWRYARAARDIAAELRDSFYSDPDASEALEAAIATMTYVEWIKWRRDNAHETARLASATPSARRRRKRPGPLLQLAAYQFCLEAASLLEATDLHMPGGSYRSTLREVGLDAGRLHEELVILRLQDFDGEFLSFPGLVPN